LERVEELFRNCGLWSVVWMSGTLEWCDTFT